MLYYLFIDVEAPKICCPSEFSINSTMTAALIWNRPKTTDNSGQVSTVTCSLESGSQFEIGATEVHCDALDSSGNQATCAFTVQVKGDAYCFDMIISLLNINVYLKATVLSLSY